MDFVGWISSSTSRQGPVSEILAFRRKLGREVIWKEKEMQDAVIGMNGDRYLSCFTST